MLVRQSKDPDSMPSRKKRRMFSRKERENTGESLSTKYPKRRVLYDPNTLIGEVFNTPEEQKEALESGKWIEHPKMSLEDWLDYRLKKYYEPVPDEEQINWAKKMKFRDSNLPPARKYLSQMNVAELIEFGKRFDLDFGTSETCPTKKVMREKITEAQIEEQKLKDDND